MFSVHSFQCSTLNNVHCVGVRYAFNTAMQSYDYITHRTNNLVANKWLSLFPLMILASNRLPMFAIASMLAIIQLWVVMLRQRSGGVITITIDIKIECVLFSPPISFESVNAWQSMQQWDFKKQHRIARIKQNAKKKWKITFTNCQLSTANTCKLNLI